MRILDIIRVENAENCGSVNPGTQVMLTNLCRVDYFALTFWTAPLPAEVMSG